MTNAQTSGHGSIDLGLGGSYSSGGYGQDSCLTVDICPDLLFAAIAAAGAAGFAFFYMAITVAGRKRKRSFPFNSIFNINPNFKEFVLNGKRQINF